MDVMDEHWKVITSHPDYEVSDQGRVRRITGGKGVRAGRVLRPQPNGTGYWQVNLYRAGRPSRQTIHSLVAAAFIGQRARGAEINHKDGDKANNAASNLEYVTPSENHAHARSALGAYMGTRNGASKLTDEEVIAIRAACAAGLSQRKVAEMFGVTQGHVSDIVRGKKRGSAHS